MAGLLLELGTMWSLLQISLAVLVYALIVNVFYQVVSKRRMFASKRDVQAEREIEAALAQAKDSAKEAAELTQDAEEGDGNGDSKELKEQRAEAVEDATQEAIDAAETAEKEIKRQVSTKRVWKRELRALVLFPLVTSLFFVLLSANLIFVGADRPPIEVYTLSLAIILAVRIAAYVNEATSHDLAKLLPLALLGFYLVDGDFAGIRAGNEALWALRDEWRLVVGFIVMITGVELALRVTYLALKRLKWAKWLKATAQRLG